MCRSCLILLSLILYCVVQAVGCPATGKHAPSRLTVWMLLLCCLNCSALYFASVCEFCCFWGISLWCRGPPRRWQQSELFQSQLQSRRTGTGQGQEQRREHCSPSFHSVDQCNQHRICKMAPAYWWSVHTSHACRNHYNVLGKVCGVLWHFLLIC